MMSDYRNYDYDGPSDPFRADGQPDLNPRPPNAAWGWIAAAIFLVVVLAVAFGYGHKPGQLGTNTAQNDATPPAVTRMAPPPSTTPTPGTPTPPPVTAMPANPAPINPAQPAH